MSSRPALDLSIYLVTDTALCGSVGVVATVEAAVRGGATLVQLRDPDCDDDTFVGLGRELVAVLAGTGVPLIVNDRAHLVDVIGADGLHIGQGDLAVDEARARIGTDRLLGLSVQTLEQLAAARAHGDLIDYLGVGPVWAQTTKPDAAAPGGIGTLAGIVAASPWPCVAIGGIGREQVVPVRSTGARGIAVVSAICGRQDPEAATRDLRRRWDEAAADIQPEHEVTR